MGSYRSFRARFGGGVKIQEKIKKKIKPFEHLFVPSLLFLVPLIASAISVRSVYWFFPLVLGLISMTGYLFKIFFFLDSGIILSAISYLFVNRAIEVSPTNLSTVLIIFFLYFTVWIIARNSLVMREIRSDLSGISAPESLDRFRISYIRDVLSASALGVFMSIIASFLAMYSSMEMLFDPNLNIVLLVIFSSAVFFITYTIISISPAE